MSDNSSTGSSAPAERWELRAPIARALVWTGVASAVVLAVLVVLGSLAVRSAAQRQGELEAASLGGVNAQRIGPLLTDKFFAGDPGQLALVDQAARDEMAAAPPVRIKIWSADGRVLYSDEPRLIGTTFPLSGPERRALQDGGVATDVSDLEEAENEFERSNGKLLEVYVGYLDGPQPVAIETYYPYDIVRRNAAVLRARFFPLLYIGLVTFALVQLPLTAWLVQRLRRIQSGRERLLTRLMDTSDRERRRIAAEVHDGAVQDLIGIGFAIDGIAAQIDDPAKARLQRLSASVSTVIRQLRSLLTSIYPVEVPPGGIAAGLDDMTSSLREHGVEVRVDVDKGLRLAPNDEAIALRVARELLGNIRRYARATEATVSIRRDRKTVIMQIEDNGVGIRPEQVQARRREGHLGLRLLEDLAADAGGTLTVTPVPEGGTRAVLELRSHI